MKAPKELLYSTTHEWVRAEGNLAYVGLTDFAQDKLGQIVFVDLPGVGDEFNARDEIAEVESVKAVSEFFTPVSGKVDKINEDLLDNPEKVNEDPYDSWFLAIELSKPEELEELLNSEKYEALIEDEEGQ